MAEQFGMEPGLGNFPKMLSDVASQLNELAAKFGPPADCATHEGDSQNYHDSWNQQPQSWRDEADWLQSLADGWSVAGGAFQASDGG